LNNKTISQCAYFARRFIDPECLPKRYGGHRDEVSLEQWLTKIRRYKNKEFDSDIRSLGYYAD
jgi:hypothetical protein